MALTKCKECGEQISKKATQCPKCGSPAKKKTSLFTWVIAIFFGLMIFGYFSGNSGTGPSGTSSAGPSPKTLAMQNTSLEYTWKKEGFDNVMMANFTIANNSETAIKDIEITCTHFAKSGTRIDSNDRTIFDVVPAHGKKVIAGFNMGFIHSQAEKTNCRITDLKL